jgi:hypothetical protein
MGYLPCNVLKKFHVKRKVLNMLNGEVDKAIEIDIFTW